MADEFVVERAERKQARLRLAVCATSNGGKTWTSLELAFGIIEELLARGLLQGTLEGKVGVVDTERKSAHLYSHLGPYDVVALNPPYTVERYAKAQRALEQAGCTVIILDSISHGWMGNGGVLALLDQFDASKRFSEFGKTLNPAQDEFVDQILRSPCHIIATMRSKTAWVIEDVEKNGRTVKAPRRVGLAPIQRPGIEYEFTTLLDLDTDTHFARVVKNRCPVFRDWQPKKITREHGRALASWLLEGAPATEEPLSGTPFERAQATASAAVRACERAANPPDLQRVYTDGVRAVRAFADVVQKEEVAKLARLEVDLTTAKDTRKVALGISTRAPTTGPVIDPAAAVELELLLRDAEVPLAECAEHFSVARRVQLPADKLQAAIDWINRESVERVGRPIALTKRLMEMGVVVTARGDAFAGMADDLPWKD